RRTRTGTVHATERRRSRTFPAWGCHASTALKAIWGTGPGRSGAEVKVLGMKGLITALAAAAVVAAPAHGATLVRLDGIGQLKLGMSRMAALDTGWLGARSTGCTLGGKPYPIDYTLTGAKAPAGIKGS